MRTKCPNCNKDLYAPNLTACPACKTVFNEYEQTQLELLQQRKDTLIAEAASQVLKRLLGWIIGALTLLGILAGIGLLQIYTGLSNLVSNRIAAQFEEPRIRETLNQVARTRASEILEEQVRPSVEAVQQATRDTLKSLETSLKDTKTKLDNVVTEFQLINEFNMTAIAAQGDDRKAFDKLEIWANDKAYPFSSLAENVWWNILQDRGGRLPGGHFVLEWRDGIEPSKLSLEQLRRTYETITTRLKPALIQFIWNRNDITQKDRMQFLMDVIENDQSLTAVEWAGRFFTTGAELQKNPIHVKVLVDWWKNNKDKFE
jgi:hypothetical protein